MRHAQMRREWLDDLRRAHVRRSGKQAARRLRMSSGPSIRCRPFYSVATVEQLLSETLAARRFTTTLLVLFGYLSIVRNGLERYRA